MPLHVSLVSADAEVWSGEASIVVAKTVEGEIGILAGHEPMLGILAQGEVRITTIDGERILADAQDGFVSIAGDEVTIVAGNAQLIS